MNDDLNFGTIIFVLTSVALAAIMMALIIAVSFQEYYERFN